MSAKPKAIPVPDQPVRAAQPAARLKRARPELPDVDSDEFKREARRQSRAAAISLYEADDQAFVDSVASIWRADD